MGCFVVCLLGRDDRKTVACRELLFLVVCEVLDAVRTATVFYCSWTKPDLNDRMYSWGRSVYRSVFLRLQVPQYNRRPEWDRGSLWENSCVRPGAGRLQLLRFVHVDSPTINLELPLIVAEERRGTPGSCWRWDCYSCYFLLDPVTYTQIFSNFSLICYLYK